MSKLRDARKSRGLTQREVADQVGITEVALSRYETGERRPRPKIGDKLIALFDGALTYADLYSAASDEPAAPAEAA